MKLKSNKISNTCQIFTSIIIFILVIISISQGLILSNHESKIETGNGSGLIDTTDPEMNEELLEIEHTRAGENNSIIDSPPYFTKQFEDVSLNEDFIAYQLALKEYAADNNDPPEALKWFITGENASMINVTNENSTDQRIILKSVDDAYGENTVRVWVSDTTGRMDFQTMTIRILPINDLPIISTSKLPTIRVHSKSRYSINLEPYILDPDTSLSKIKVTVQPVDSQVASMKNHILNIDFREEEDLNKDHITLKLTDGEDPGVVSNAKIKLNITNNYPPELINKIPDMKLFTGESLSKIMDLDYYFTDPDDNRTSLTYELFSSEHLKTELFDDNTVDIKYTDAWEGRERLIIRCIDPWGAFVEQVLNISISSTYLPLIFHPIPDLQVHNNLEYIFNLTPYITNQYSNIDLNFILYEFEGNDWVENDKWDNIAIEYNQNTILKINYSIEYLNKSIPVLISISDGVLTKVQEFNIKVTDNYPPIFKKKIPNHNFNEDQINSSTIDLYDYFSDIENNNLKFSSINEKVILDIDSTGIVYMTSKPNWFGIELVTIRALDTNNAIIESSFMVTINPINDPPKIMPIPKINVTKGVGKSIDYSIYISDVDNNISELILTVEDDYVSILGDLLILNYPVDKTGNQQFNLILSDGEHSDSQTVNVSIISDKDSTAQSNEDSSPIVFWGSIIIIVVMILILAIISIVYVYRLRTFRFNEIFLIYKDGVLIAHSTREKRLGSDTDIIGSMFTAIQDFIQESFTNSSRKGNSSLKRLDFGNFQIVINRGKYIFIAAVFSGVPLRKMLLKIERLRKDVENKFSKVLPVWSGDMAEMVGAQKLLETLLYSTGPSQKKPVKSGASKPRRQVVKYDEPPSDVELESNPQKNANNDDDIENDEIDNNNDNFQEDDIDNPDNDDDI